MLVRQLRRLRGWVRACREATTVRMAQEFGAGAGVGVGDDGAGDFEQVVAVVVRSVADLDDSGGELTHCGSSRAEVVRCGFRGGGGGASRRRKVTNRWGAAA
jgi:hypothetical protein